MGPLADRRNQMLLGGGALALLAGLGLAALLTRERPGDANVPPPPASEAGLVVEAAPTDERLDPARPLRCFVGGQFAGEMSLTDCARRNGVATDALDVGVDQTGALAAAEQAGTVLTPLPPMGEATSAPLSGPPAPAVQAPPAAQPRASGPTAACWRYSGSEWRKLPAEMTLTACLQTLYGGRCERPGSAAYGRWGQQTVRLVPGRVEISSDNRSFRPLTDQGPGCAIPPVG
jgi:hypothetical protein